MMRVLLSIRLRGFSTEAHLKMRPTTERVGHVFRRAEV
jgi:hypothetical protein